MEGVETVKDSDTMLLIMFEGGKLAWIMRECLSLYSSDTIIIKSE